MADCKVTVDPGVCKMNTVIVAKQSDDMMSVTFEVQSTCPHVRQMAEKVKSVEPYPLMAEHICQTPFYKAADECLPHIACPVPCGFIKAMEVAAGLGLKRDVTFKIEDA